MGWETARQWGVSSWQKGSTGEKRGERRKKKSIYGGSGVIATAVSHRILFIFLIEISSEFSMHKLCSITCSTFKEVLKRIWQRLILRKYNGSKRVRVRVRSVERKGRNLMWIWCNHYHVWNFSYFSLCPLIYILTITCYCHYTILTALTNSVKLNWDRNGFRVTHNVSPFCDVLGHYPL